MTVNRVLVNNRDSGGSVDKLVDGLFASGGAMLWRSINAAGTFASGMLANGGFVWSVIAGNEQTIMEKTGQDAAWLEMVGVPFAAGLLAVVALDVAAVLYLMWGRTIYRRSVNAQEPMWADIYLQRARMCQQWSGVCEGWSTACTVAWVVSLFAGWTATYSSPAIMGLSVLMIVLHMKKWKSIYNYEQMAWEVDHGSSR